MLNMEQKIDIKSLYDELSQKYDVQNRDSYEVIYPANYEIKVCGNKYVKLIALSRHKTSKHLMQITVKSEKTINSLDPINQAQILKRYDDITVTTDHICMIYNSDHFFENIDAKHLKLGQYVSVYVKIKSLLEQQLASKIQA